MATKNPQLLSAIKQAAISITSPVNYDPILQAIGDAKVVMIGEASHGTHDFYKHRVELTKRLIKDKGFDLVCVEGDWPDAYQINRYIKGHGSATDAFSGFKRFPTWMWKNDVVADFSQWLREYNAKQKELYQVGFYGLDIYSLHESAQAVIEYLKTVDPAAASRARSRYSCFDHYGEDAQSYGMAAAFGMSSSCEQGAIGMLLEMQKRMKEKVNLDGMSALDKEFYAFVNAIVVKDAEEYYRGMFLRKNTWNIRDNHMERTLEQLMEHVASVRKRDESAPQAAKDQKVVKAVIWAHNSHLGDARYTEFADRGEQNVGQLVRQRFGKDQTYNVGFTTFTGTVTAADEWDDPPQTMQVRPADSDTYEKLFHDRGGDFIIRFRANKSAGVSLSPEEQAVVDILSQSKKLMERAIGVIYRPRTERMSHLFHAQIAEQFDSVIHLDKTSALQPIDDGYLAKMK